MNFLFFTIFVSSKFLIVLTSTHVFPPDVVIFNPKTKEVVEEPFVEYLEPKQGYRRSKDFMNFKKGENRGIVESTLGKLREETGNQGEEPERNGPCFCRNETVGPMCGCCFGMRIDRFNFSRELCGQMVYDPYLFSMNLDMNMNGNSFYQNSWSGRNPPPLCMPMPIPGTPILMEMCMKFFDIFQPGRNLHMCMDMEMMIQKFKVLILHFNCVRIGQDFAFLRPEDNGGIDENGNVIK